MSGQLNKNDRKGKDLPVLNFGWTVAGEFLFCFFVGYYADQKFESGYRWTLLGIGVGVVLIVYELWKLLRRSESNND